MFSLGKKEEEEENTQKTNEMSDGLPLLCGSRLRGKKRQKREIRQHFDFFQERERGSQNFILTVHFRPLVGEFSPPFPRDPFGQGKEEETKTNLSFPPPLALPPAPGRLQSFEVQFVMLSVLLLFPNAGAGDSETAQFGCKNSGHTIPPPLLAGEEREEICTGYIWEAIFFKKVAWRRGRGGHSSSSIFPCAPSSFAQNRRENSQNAQFAMFFQSVLEKQGF